MIRSRNKISYGSWNKSSSLLALNEIDDFEKSIDWRKNYIVTAKEIGRGHFSKVFLVTSNAHNESFAAKVIRRRKAGVDRLDKIRKEAEIIKRLNEKNIASVIKLFETHESFNEVVLICELAKGGSLFNVIQDSETGLNQNYVKCVVYKILLALESLHIENIVHLDIKADNILLRERYPSTNIAICDFGLATELKKGINHKELVGTPDYMAPEIVNYERITLNADMWSVGVLTYYLLTRISPFMGQSKEETLINVSRVKIIFDSTFQNQDFFDVKDFISALCVKDPNSRLCSNKAQVHSWFENISDLNIDYPLQSPIPLPMTSAKASINISDYKSLNTLTSSHRCQSVDLSSIDYNCNFRVSDSNLLKSPKDFCKNTLTKESCKNDSKDRKEIININHSIRESDEFFYEESTPKLKENSPQQFEPPMKNIIEESYVTEKDSVKINEKEQKMYKIIGNVELSASNTTDFHNDMDQKTLKHHEDKINSTLKPVDISKKQKSKHPKVEKLTDLKETNIQIFPQKNSQTNKYFDQIQKSNSDKSYPQFDSGFSECNQNYFGIDLEEYDNISDNCEEKPIGKDSFKKSLSSNNQIITKDDEDEDDYRYTSLLTNFKFSELCILL